MSSTATRSTAACAPKGRVRASTTRRRRMAPILLLLDAGLHSSDQQTEFQRLRKRSVYGKVMLRRGGGDDEPGTKARELGEDALDPFHALRRDVRIDEHCLVLPSAQLFGKLLRLSRNVDVVALPLKNMEDQSQNDLVGIGDEDSLAGQRQTSVPPTLNVPEERRRNDPLPRGRERDGRGSYFK